LGHTVKTSKVSITRFLLGKYQPLPNRYLENTERQLSNILLKRIVHKGHTSSIDSQV
jgi:hypothetical protein